MRSAAPSWAMIPKQDCRPIRTLYLFELQMWQRGFRKSSPESKALIAKQLDEQQIAAVAAYYQEFRSSNSVATTK
jgi:cytochrome c553